MKKFTTFIYSFIALVLCSGVLIFGVLALNQTSFSLNNNILYTPTSAYVIVDATIDGFNANKLDEDERLKTSKTFASQNTPEGELTDENGNASWDVPALDFENKETPIIFTFTVKNTGEYAVKVYIEIDDTEVVNPVETEKLIRGVEKYESVGDSLDENEMSTNKILNTQDLIIEPNETGVIRLILKVNPSYNEGFENENNNFKIIISE